MKKRPILLLVTVLCASQFLLAQVSIHDGTVPSPGSDPDGSSMLDVRASDKGMLVPRVSLSGPSDATTILTPATSLLVYNLSSSGGLTPGYYYNSGTSVSPAWLRLVSGAINLTNQVSGLLPVANGGTGIGSLTGVVIGNGTAAMSATAGTASQFLRRNAANSAYEFVTLTPAIVGVANLTQSTGITAFTYNGGSAATIGLANTAVTAGTYGNTGANITQITVDAQGRLTAASNRALTPALIGMANLTESTGITPFTYNGGSAATIGLANTAVTAGTYGNTGANITQITVDAQGRLTAASNRALTPALIGMANLTQSTGITAFTYNGGSAATIALANTAVTAGTYGNTGANITQITVDAQGRLTAASNRALTPALIGMTDLTFDNSGLGVASGTIYNGSTARTISYNTIGATGGSGTANYLARWITATTLGNGTVRDDGVTVGVNMAPNASRMLSSTSATTTADGAALWGNATGAARVYGVFGSISSTTSAAAAVRGNATGTSGDTYGVFGENISNGTSSAGVRGLATGNNGKGVLGQNNSTGTGSQYGVYGQKSGATGTGTGYGVYGTATGTATINIGGYFTATGGTANYGLIVPSDGGNVGIGTLTPGAKLDIAAGADNNGTNDQVALSLQYRTGGYRHFIRSRHNSTITGHGNDIDFYVNNSTATAGSSAPATGNTLVMTMESFNGTPRVGVGIAAPLQTLHVNGGTVRVSNLATAGNKMVYADNNGDLMLSDTDLERMPRRDWRPYGTPSHVWDGLTQTCATALTGLSVRGSAVIGSGANYCTNLWGGKRMLTITGLSQEAQTNNAAPANGIYLNLPATAGVHNNLLISTIDNDRWSVWSVWLCNSAGTPIVKLARNANNASGSGSNASTYTLGPYNNVKETGSHAWVAFPVTKAQVDAQISGGNLRFLLTSGPSNSNGTTLYLSGFALVPNPHGFMQHPALSLHYALNGQTSTEMTWNNVWNNDGLVEVPAASTRVAHVKVIDSSRDLLVTFYEHNTNWHGGNPTITVGSNTTVFRPTRGIDGIGSRMYGNKLYMDPQCIIIPQAIVAAQIIQAGSGVPSTIKLNITMTGENKYHFRGIDTEIW